MSKEESGTGGGSQNSLAMVLKSLAMMLGKAVAFMAILLASVCVYFYLDDKSFGLQVATLIAYTGLVPFYIFSAFSGLRGYSLRRKSVQQQIPRLLIIHGVFLACIFAAQTYALSLRPHLSAFWLEEKEGTRDVSWFVWALILVCMFIALTQIYVSRRLLGRSIPDEKAT